MPAPNAIVIVEGIDARQFDGSELSQHVKAWLESLDDSSPQIKIVIDGHIVQYQPVPIESGKCTIVVLGQEMNRVFRSML